MIDNIYFILLQVMFDLRVILTTYLVLGCGNL